MSHNPLILSRQVSPWRFLKIWSVSIKRLRSYERFCLRGAFSPKLSSPLAAKLLIGPEKVTEVQYGPPLYHRSECSDARTAHRYFCLSRFLNGEQCGRVSPLSSLCSETVLMSVDSTRFVVVHLYAFSCVFASLDCAMPLLPEWAWSESRDPFWSPCHIFGSSEARILKFFTQVSHCECLHWHDKIPPKWACLGLR